MCFLGPSRPGDNVQEHARKQHFKKGQGYKLDSFLPKPSNTRPNDNAAVAMEETFQPPSTDWLVTRDWQSFPATVQKACANFDPKDLLFRGGAHMPLLLFVGNKPRRSPEGVQNRECKARVRRKKKAEEKKAMQANAGAASSEQPTPAIAGSAASSSTRMTWREFSNNCRQKDGWWKRPCCGTLVIDEDELANHAWDSRGKGHPNETIQVAWREGPWFIDPR